MMTTMAMMAMSSSRMVMMVAMAVVLLVEVGADVEELVLPASALPQAEEALEVEPEEEREAAQAAERPHVYVGCRGGGGVEPGPAAARHARQ